MKTIYSVGQINRYVKNMFVQDFVLRKVYVKGEVSNCKYHPSGHIYFSLKDETGVLSCVMFAGQRRGLAFRMKDGDRVVAGGTVDVYERDGRYQLYAREITLEGAGALYERFLALKAELEEMGMFAAEYKQPIPPYIRRLGVVTAPTGAAVQDIRNISLRRNPYLQIILYPALVQGEGAADSIVRGIRMLDRAGVDVIIVGRGGGSIEDLWAFNEEKVARAIFECRTPVISAVGHETDFTIADFVADKRAATPSAAAELCTFEYEVFLEELSKCRDELDASMQRKLRRTRDALTTRELRIRRHDPGTLLSERKRRLKELHSDMDRQLRLRLKDARARLEASRFDLYGLMTADLKDRKHGLRLRAARLEGLSPLRRISGGFGYICDEDGRAVRSVSSVKEGDMIHTRLRDGSILSRVASVDKEESYGQEG